MDKVKVLVVDDHIQFRWGMLEVLAREETLEIVEEASDGNEAIEKAKAVKPQVVLMDLNMPNCDGVEATSRLQKEMPETNVLILTVSESGTDLIDALKAGARGYLLKHEKPEQIIQAIHYITRGGLLISPSMITKLQKELGGQQPVEQKSDVAVLGEPEAQTSPATVQEEAEPVQEIAEERAEAVTEPPPESYETFDAPPGVAYGDLVSEADVAISPPLEPSLVLQLHQWLREVAKGDVGKITSPLGGTAVVSLAFRDPTPLKKMLAELPYVAEVEEELQSAEAQEAGRSGIKRFRLTLKAKSTGLTS